MLFACCFVPALAPYTILRTPSVTLHFVLLICLLLFILVDAEPVRRRAAGRSRFQINGRSAAGAEAVAIASAIVDVAGTVEVCGECSVAAALWARSYEEILISASSVSELALNGSSTPGQPLELRTSAFRAEFGTASAEATADVRPPPRV